MRYESINDMPEMLRERVKKQLEKEGCTADFSSKGSSSRKKYGNRVTFVGNVKFDSLREAERYQVLMIRLGAGEIDRLKLQPEFTISESYRLPDGRLVKAQRYRADFSYYIKSSGEFIVEDVKTEGTKTRVFINKSKMLYEKYGFVVTLV